LLYLAGFAHDQEVGQLRRFGGMVLARQARRG